MRIGRAVIIPVILALGLAGSVLAGSEMPVATGHTAGVHALATDYPSASGVYYHN